MKKFAILTLTMLIAIIGSTWGQCTITQPTILNSSISSSVTTFDLQFKHDRNSGNKWITIHLWAALAYPNYNYARVPTTIRLGGSSSVPFGTVVINNTSVDHDGIYTADQAYVGAYQNDGTFIMLNTSISTLVYNSSTGVYVLKNLRMIVPAGTTVIKFDSWSSQSDPNNNVHCYCVGGSIAVPVAMPVTGLEETFNIEKTTEGVNFQWTSYAENNNAFYKLQELVDSVWIDKALISSKYEDGNCPHSTDYQYTLKLPSKSVLAMVGMWPLLFVFALLFRRLVPARLTLLVGFVVGMTLTYSCNSTKNSLDSLLTDHWYRLKQVDKDGKSFVTTARMIRM